MPSLTTPGPYPDAASAVVDNVLFQVFYRQLSTVAVHFGVAKVYAAAIWLSQNGRGGSVSWKVPGRVALWTGVVVVPGVAGAPTINVWIFGAALTQWNSVLVKQGFWTLELEPGNAP